MHVINLIKSANRNSQLKYFSSVSCFFKTPIVNVSTDHVYIMPSHNFFDLKPKSEL